MKKVNFLVTAIFAIITLASCSNDDAPEEVHEEEVITTMTVTLTPDGGGTAITLQARDLDGDGTYTPTVSGDLAAGVTYDGAIELLNETENPAEDITEEVEEEDDEHQFFYTVGSGLDVTTTYANFDGDGNPLGTEFTLVAGAASSGNITFTLRHEPTKPNTGLGDAGGETDITVTFAVTVQ